MRASERGQDADFDPKRMIETPALIRRGIRAGLIGLTGHIAWTVSDDGWSFEACETIREGNRLKNNLILRRLACRIVSHVDLATP